MAIVGTQDIRFGGYSLQVISGSDKILTENIIYNDLPEKIINIKSDTIRDGFDVISEQYTQKIITINGWLVSDTGANLKTLIDTFKGYLRPKEQNLEIESSADSGTYTRWVATTQAISIPEERNTLTQKPFSVEFLCQPFGKDSSSSSSYPGEIASLSDEIINNPGTYKVLPIITLYVRVADGLTKIRLTTGTDWIEVEPDSPFINDDSLVIDCNAETVELNDAPQDFSGVFPSFASGTPTFDFDVTGAGASLSYDLTITYWLRYL